MRARVKRDSAWTRRGSLALLCWVAYFPALWGTFVWDDRNILDKSFPTGWKGLSDIWSNPSVIPAEEYYWPLTYTSLPTPSGSSFSWGSTERSTMASPSMRKKRR